MIFLPVSKQVISRVQKNAVRLKNRINTWALGSGSAFHSTAGLLIGIFFSPSVRVHNILSSDVGFWVNPFFIIFFLLLELPAKLKYNKYFPFVVFLTFQFSAHFPSFGDTILEDFLSVCRINMIKSEREWCVCVCAHVGQVWLRIVSSSRMPA